MKYKENLTNHIYMKDFSIPKIDWKKNKVTKDSNNRTNKLDLRCMRYQSYCKAIIIKATDKGLISKIYKQLLQLNCRKINDPIIK